ncbi:MAG: SDR family NAD(P)-dependent oxidoreductase [Comamonadaceae bacterium]|nr:MAG: SDR family NAD(P)-dependent oxidoreductase [Comamonadaceae bacterium]
MQNSEWNLADKAILVTGASSGIGAATAVALGRQRARVVLAARRVADCEAVAEQVRAAGGDAWVTPVDVTDRMIYCSRNWRSGIKIILILRGNNSFSNGNKYALLILELFCDRLKPPTDPV